jgi:hypothetical protein
MGSNYEDMNNISSNKLQIGSIRFCGSIVKEQDGFVSVMRSKSIKSFW